MVVGVKVLSSSGFKGYCRSCRTVLVNGQLVCFVHGTSSRSYHLDCDWRGRLQVHLRAGAQVLIDSGVPDADRLRVKARLAHAMRQAQERAEADVRGQLACKQQLLLSYPVGCRLVYTYEDARTCFCEVVAYSKLGNSVRLRQVESTAEDTWVEQGRRWLTVVHKRRAHWGSKTDLLLNVRTCHFGNRLVRGSDYEGRAVQYDPAAIRVVEEVAASGTQVVNVRSLAGALWFSGVLGTSLMTAHQLQAQVADAIALIPGRGTVLLTHGARLLGRTDCLASLLHHEANAPIEVVAVVEENSNWARSIDGRPMPYFKAHPVVGESLAFDVKTMRAKV